MFLKTFLISLILCFSALAANQPPVISVGQGGYQGGTSTPAVISPLNASNKVTLVGGSSGTAGAGNFFTLAAMASPGGQYTVGAGTLDCYNLTVSTNASEFFLFGYGDDAVTDDTNTPPTNPVYFGPSSSTAKAIIYSSGGFSTRASYPIFMSFAATKLPFLKQGGTGGDQFNVQLDCIQK